jgi:hypothetical protein
MHRSRCFAVCLVALVALSIGVIEATPPEFSALLGTWETHIHRRGRNICYPCRLIIQDVADNGDILGQFFQGDQIRELQAKAVRNGDKIEVEGVFPATRNRLSLVLEGHKSLSGWGMGTSPSRHPLSVQFHKVE